MSLFWSSMGYVYDDQITHHTGESAPVGVLVGVFDRRTLNIFVI